eukprot:3212338-Pleurochrysis_carterae.AAC.1
MNVTNTAVYVAPTGSLTLARQKRSRAAIRVPRHHLRCAAAHRVRALAILLRMKLILFPILWGMVFRPNNIEHDLSQPISQSHVWISLKPHPRRQNELQSSV